MFLFCVQDLGKVMPDIVLETGSNYNCKTEGRKAEWPTEYQIQLNKCQKPHELSSISSYTRQRKHSQFMVQVKLAAVFIKQYREGDCISGVADRNIQVLSLLYNVPSVRKNGTGSISFTSKMQPGRYSINTEIQNILPFVYIKTLFST